jgi:glutamate formiminotransferase/formiminotetrahydrofolate cyclodeaminase
MPQPILECVPNFSEGRDPEVIRAIADAMSSVPAAQLLHIDTSPSANRTVMTCAGAPEAVVEAAFRGISVAAERIDMSVQGGVHPRVGATDVCPLVPLAGLSMQEADAYAKQLGERVGTELGIPVYLYEHSASATHRSALPDIRKGQYEGFAKKMQLPDWAPDFGPKVFNPKTGVSIIGARDILVAFNISLDGGDLQTAEYIASRIRSRGYFEGEGADRHRVPGLLNSTRAIGWFMEDYQQAQVSINLLDFRRASPLQAWEACKMLAAEKGLQLVGSEVIGLVPEVCLLEAGSFALRRQNVPAREVLVHAAIDYLGLSRLKPFPVREKVLDYALADAGMYL